MSVYFIVSKGGSMTGKTRSSLLSLAIITVLLLGALSPTTAYADDGTPPDSPPTEASTECTSGSDCPSDAGAAPENADPAEVTAEATDPPVEATAEPTEAAPEATAEATDTPDEAPAEAGGEGDSSSGEPTALPTEEPAPIAEQGTVTPEAGILAEIPDATTITVVDAEGQIQPLVTQEVADAIVTSDPIWCPAGQDPTPGANGCTASFNSFDALLSFLSGNATYQGPGTIYIQQGAYNGGEASIDFNSPAYDLSNIRNSDLTLKGGWNTATNTVDPASTSDFTIPIIIGNSTNPWGGSLTINNITINKTDGTGLTLHSQNNILVSNVTVTNSVNGAGAELNAGREASINNSRFDRNKTAGAIVRAGGSVSVDNSSFSNPPDGRRQIVGLDIISGGAVSLANIEANENREVGTNVEAAGQVAIAGGFFSGTKTIKGADFLGYGLKVVTPETIAIASVTANDNFLWGASFWTGRDIVITDSVFNANTTESPGFIDDTGLLITSAGVVSLNNVQANDNRLIGATIEAGGDVRITSSTFNNNNGVTLDANGTPTFHGYGLRVVTPGNISLDFVSASNNTLFGARLEAGANVNVSSSNFDNQTSPSTMDPTGRGLEIVSGGNVFLRSVTMNNNQTFGGSIQASGDIFLTSVTATGNGLDGLDVQASCTEAFLGGGTFSNNGQFGLSVINAEFAQDGTTVFSNNGAGDIFEDPGTCVFNPPNNTNNPGTPPITNNTGLNPAPATFTGNSIEVDLQESPSLDTTAISFVPATGLTSNNVTSNRFLAKTGTASGIVQLNMFTGKYAYLYSDSGVLHIITFSPFSNILAMGGS